MNTFVNDVTNLIEAEELSDVVLVGHSFGGYVITAVADLIPERLSQLVYLDAAVATHGASPLSELPPEVREARLRSAVQTNGVRVFGVPDARSFGITEDGHAAWVTRRMSPMPVKAYETAFRFHRAPGGSIPKHYIRCVAPRILQVELGYQYARENGWKCLELPCGHDAVITAPDVLAGALIASLNGPERRSRMLSRHLRGGRACG